MFVDPYIGTVTVFAGNFAPLGWHLCDGTLLDISSNDALYSLIGNAYGGDGVSNFALPDLRSRTAVHPGTGKALSPISLAQTGGAENVTLSQSNVALHTHALVSFSGAQGCSTNPGNLGTPAGNVPASTGNVNIYNEAAGTTTMRSYNITANTVASAGGSQPINIVSPVLAMNYIICIEGIYPSRN